MGALVSGCVTGDRARGKQVFRWLFERSAGEVDLDSSGHAFPEEGGGITQMICCYFVLLFGYSKTEHTDLSFLSDPAMVVSMLSKGLFDNVSLVVCTVLL